jgi:uroporphyrinogen decarboxylase
MRQAGRSLPEYRALRRSGSILEVVRQPDLAAEITLQPVRRYGVDAAILYSDIVVPVAAIGFGVDIKPGVGPVVDQPFRSEADLVRLRDLEPEVDLPWVAETVKILVGELDVPLIGFAGAPFTLASYLIEGGPSRSFIQSKRLMYGDPELWARLLDRLADVTIASLRSQIDAGVAAVQLFDSWVGNLSPADYARHVAPATGKVFAALGDLGVPRIHFGVGTGELLDQMAAFDVEVVGVDWRVPLGRARTLTGPDRALQGNLDPTALFAPPERLEELAGEVLEQGASAGPGYIFNLGHGVMPETDPDQLLRLTELVRGWTAGRAGRRLAELGGAEPSVVGSPRRRPPGP